jgi:hypothetical protein
MINVLKQWKKIFQHIFGTKEFKTALAKSEDKVVISSKHVPILIFYPTNTSRPKDCFGVRGVWTDTYDDEHQKIEIWYFRGTRDYDFFTRRDRFSRVIMIPPTEHGTKIVMRFSHLVVTEKKEMQWGSEITYIGRPVQEARHV